MLRFALAYLPPDLHERHSAYWAPTRLDRSVPLEPKSLAKIALATEPEQTVICVYPRTRGRLAIWGLLRLGTAWDRGRRDCFFSPIGGPTKQPPDFLRIQSVAPGHIAVDTREGTLASFRSGVLEDRPAPILSLPGVLTTEIHEWSKSFGLPEPAHRSSFQDVFRAVASGILSHGHGGLLLISPDEHASHPVLKFAYRCRPASQDLAERLREDVRTSVAAGDCTQHGGNSLPRGHRCDTVFDSYLTAREALLDACAFVAALTRIDGAVVLSRRLELLGYGARVEAASPTHVYETREANGGARRRFRVLARGLRFRAAAAFCKSTPGALAFIASQDGGLAILWNPGEAVVMWPDVNLDRLGPADLGRPVAQ